MFKPSNIAVKFRRFLTVASCVENLEEILLTYMGIKKKAGAKIKHEDIQIYLEIEKNNSTTYTRLIRLCRFFNDYIRTGLIKLTKSEHSDKYYLTIKNLNIKSQPLTLTEIIDLYTINVFSCIFDLIKAGATFDPINSIITLEFYQNKPRFKLNLFSSMINEIWKAFYSNFFDKLLKIDRIRGTVVDIGAFIGDTPIYFALKGADSVIALEPVTSLFNLMVENIKLNNLEDKIIAKKLGIAGNYGSTYLKKSSDIDPYTGAGEAAISMFTRGGLVEEVSVMPLSELISELGEIYLVKMNCEGCEYPAILSASPEVLKKVQIFVIQIHKPYGNPTQIVQKLESSGFHIVNSYDEWIVAKQR